MLQQPSQQQPTNQDHAGRPGENNQIPIDHLISSVQYLLHHLQHHPHDLPVRLGGGGRHRRIHPLHLLAISNEEKNRWLWGGPFLSDRPTGQEHGWHLQHNKIHQSCSAITGLLPKICGAAQDRARHLCQEVHLCHLSTGCIGIIDQIDRAYSRCGADREGSAVQPGCSLYA